MSLVYITHHSENIENIDNQGDQIGDRPPRYKSKFNKSIRSHNKRLHIIDFGNEKLITTSILHKSKTMGPAETEIKPPCSFLRKGQGIKWKHENDHESFKCPQRAVSDENRERSWRTGRINCNECFHGNKPKNFIKLNIKNIKNVQPKNCASAYVDTWRGDRQNLANSGLIPQYACSKKFGKIPTYIQENKKQVQKNKETDLSYKEFNGWNDVRKITAEEREEILRGLRANYSEIFKIYQKSSLLSDTITKKMRKAKLEHHLRQLEQDIHLMESNPIIYVSKY